MPRTKKQSTEAAVREIRRRTRRKFSPEEKVRADRKYKRGLGVTSEHGCYDKSAWERCAGGANAHFALALVHHRSGLYDEAIAHYPSIDQDRSQYGRSSPPALARARFSSHQARGTAKTGSLVITGRSIRTSRRTLPRDPRTSETARGRATLHAALGDDWEQTGRDDLAHSYYRLALEADPGKTLARDLRERLSRLSGSASSPKTSDAVLLSDSVDR